jgi:hypothetical protein
MRSLFFAVLTLALTLGLVACDSGGTGAEQLGDNTGIFFAASEASVDEGVGSYTVDIEVADPGFKELSVDVSLSDQSTISASDVRGLPSDTTIAFSKETTAGETQSLTFEIVDDDEFLEGDETVVLTLQNPSQSSLGDPSTFTLTIEENDVTLTTQEARDLPEGSRAVVDGIVTRVEADGLYLQDDAGALFVFDDSIVDAVGRGDEIRVDGTTGFFSGLFQLEDVGTEGLTTISTGNDLPEPQTVTLDSLANNGEAFESELIRVQGFAIDSGGDASFQGGTNYNIEDDTGTLILRIPSGSGLVGEDIPDRANFQGVLGQFNGGGSGADEPDSGYQLLGLTADDLENAAPATQTIADARAQPMGTTVTIEGTVTRAFNAFVRIQDSSGPTGASGIVIRQTSGSGNADFRDDVADGTIQPGTQLRLTGVTSAFSGLIQINNEDLASYEVTGQGAVPTPQTISLDQLADDVGEDYESELVRVEGLTFPDASGTFENGTTYTVEEGGGTQADLRVQGEDETALGGASIPGGTFTYIGIVGQFNNFGDVREDGGYQLIPVRESDLQ